MRASRSALAGLAAAAIGLALLGPARHRLADARRQQVEIAAIVAAPAAPVPALLAGGTPFVGDRAAAAGMLSATIRTLAAREDLLLEVSEARPGPAAALVARHVILSGGTRAVPRLIEAIETRTPPIRFTRYRLSAGSGGVLRLDAVLVMPWRARP